MMRPGLRTFLLFVALSRAGAQGTGDETAGFHFDESGTLLQPAGAGGFSLGLSAVDLLEGPERPPMGPLVFKTSVPPLASPVKLRNENRSYGHKFLRGEAIIGGVEVGSLLVMAALPRSVSKWDAHPFDKAAASLKKAWTEPPVWDKDIWFHNFVGHPYAGALYYNMVRSQGATPLQSFLFSTAQSVLFEYVVEGVAEQPSIQDLIITSTVGSILGEVLHRITLRMMEKGGLTFWQKVLVFGMNPSFVLNNGFSPPRRDR